MKASLVLITVLLLVAAAEAASADPQELQEANQTLSTITNKTSASHHHDHDHHEDQDDHGHGHHEHHDEKHASSKVLTSDSSDNISVFHLWLYGTGAVIFISVAGLLAITTIPKIASHHHGDILQLLVGLAIGTLTSDALLHLLPHAFSGATHEHRAHTDDDTSSHSHRSESADHSHTQNVWNGLMALMGIIGFLAFERILTIVSDLCSKSNRTKVSSCDREPGEKGDHHSHNHKESLLLPPGEGEKLPEKNCEHNEKDQVGKDAIDQVSCMNVGPDAPLTTEQCHRETMVYQHPDPDRGYVIQLMDHHHHHQHGSTSQKGAKSVIYMIITGDGLHNFFDGLAIGIAFAGGISGGISTSVAVLCHELPHEVGDFAVLLKAGLAAKKAIMYNTLSAFLCFIGMTVGVLVANMDTGMLSSIIAGMFLYIALVDMIPQLDCCPTATGTTRAFKLTVQLFGMGIGVTIMSIISIYEPALQRIMS